MDKEKLLKLTTDELLAILDKERANTGWTSSKAKYLGTIKEILEERGEEDKL